MNQTPPALTGVVHGKVIQLEHAPELPDGQRVSVILQPLELTPTRIPGEGIRRSAGGWADDAEELDAFLEWNRRQRQVARRALRGLAAGLL